MMKWMTECYSRLLIDNHITDLKPEFMTRFDPEEYVRMVRMAGVDSAMVYACCHNGNCYYPTAVGHMHGNLAGRDIFGATVNALRREKIVPIAYYTVIFHNHSAKDHPEWRQRDIGGKEHSGRYWYSCPNHPGYVDHVLAQLTEIAAYDVAGYFIDMTFWPLVCQCDHCRSKYRAETGRDIPQRIDWNSSEWVGFQRARERWMAEFAEVITNHLKELDPERSVTHQFSPVLHGWFLGQSSGIAQASDYASGDFYGNKYQHRLGAKIFAAYSRLIPYEFMTSRCVDLHDHTSTKSEEELFLHAGSTLANGGAYFFIDAINPDGTLNERVYRRIGRVVQRLKPFKDCVQRHTPSLRAECGLYFSMSSCVNAAVNGTELKQLAEGGINMDVRYNAVVEEVTGTSIILSRRHLPYRAVTDRTADLSGFKTLIVNNAAYMSAEEVGRIERFVREGGTLIATGMTSFYDLAGNTTGNFQLAEVFGVRFSGRYTDKISYLDLGAGRDLVSCSQLPAPLVTAVAAAVEGTVTLPDFPVGDAEHYASIHSNPPGEKTVFAGLTVNRYGRGKCVYLYSSLLKHRQDSQQGFGGELLAEYVPALVAEAANLPISTEVTLLESSDRSALILGLVNYQEELPNIPARDLQLTVRLPEGVVPRRLTRVSTGEDMAFRCEDGMVSLALDVLDDVEMIEIN